MNGSVAEVDTNEDGERNFVEAIMDNSADVELDGMAADDVAVGCCNAGYSSAANVGTSSMAKQIGWMRERPRVPGRVRNNSTIGRADDDTVYWLNFHSVDECMRVKAVMAVLAASMSSLVEMSVEPRMRAEWLPRST